jgi:hypothetical protein
MATIGTTNCANASASHRYAQSIKFGTH